MEYENKYKKSKILNIVLASIVIGILIGGFSTYGLINNDGADRTDIAEATKASKINEYFESPVIGVADKVTPSIVMISKEEKVRDYFFNTAGVRKGTGSGIIYRENGYIITNNHVVEGASSLKVTLQDGRTFDARVLGGDAKSDLAVIKINADNLPAADLGDSSKVKVGQLAVAIGTPAGEEFSGSVTAGIVSAIDRKLKIGEKELNLIQTDAAINPGNSGGALVNKDGEIVGINSAKLTDTQIEGMGFAIPINDAMPIIEELVNHGYVKRPWIGVGIRTVTDQISKTYDIPKGAYVAKVYYNSPAEESGLRVDDIITEIDGEKVESVEDLSNIIGKHEPDETVKIKVYRDKKYKTVDVKLGIINPNE